MEYLKKRWKEMDRGRRGMVLIQPVLFLLSLIVALTFGKQQVISYHNSTFHYQTEGDAAVYSGRVYGSDVKFAVSSGQVVECWLDGEYFACYTITEDPAAIPDGEDVRPYGWEGFTGVEIRRGDEVWFRGAYSPGLVFGLYDEDGTNRTFSVTVGPANPEPTPGDVLYVAQGPEIERRGYWPAALLGALLGAVCVLLVLFEAQLYRWQMSFRMRRPEQAEPTEWEILSRWISWIMLTAAAAFLYALSAGLFRF